MLEGEYDASVQADEPEVVPVPVAKPATVAKTSVPPKKKKEPIRKGDEIVWRDPKEEYKTPYRGTVKWSGVPGGTYNQQMFVIEFVSGPFLLLKYTPRVSASMCVDKLTSADQSMCYFRPGWGVEKETH